MENLDLGRQYSQLLELIESTAASTDGNLELQGHWGKYVCVLASGFIENSISLVYTEFVASAASPHVIKYTQNSLKKIQNPKASKFQDVAFQFKREWGQALKGYFEAHPEYKDAIDSIMRNRHLIVHGKNCNISIHQVKEYLEKSVFVIEFIEDQCANRTPRS